MRGERTRPVAEVTASGSGTLRGERMAGMRRIGPAAKTGAGPRLGFTGVGSESRRPRRRGRQDSCAVFGVAPVHRFPDRKGSDMPEDVVDLIMQDHREV